MIRRKMLIKKWNNNGVMESNKRWKGVKRVVRSDRKQKGEIGHDGR